LSRPAFLIALAVASLAAPELPAQQPETSADPLFREARELLKQGKLDQACPKFLESQRLDPATGTLLAVAACHEHQGRLATAWMEFTEVAERARSEGREDRASLASQRAQVLRPRLSTLTVELAAELRSLEGLSIEHNGEAFTSAAWDRVLPVDGGEHVFELRAPGYAPSKRTVTVLREGDEATIRLPALRRGAPANTADSAHPAIAFVAPSASAGPHPSQASAAAADKRDEGLSKLQIAGIGLGAAALGAAAVGGLFFLTAKGKMIDSEPFCDGEQCDPRGLKLRSSAVAWGNRATLLGVSGAVLAITGIVLYRVGQPDASSAAASSASLSVQAAPGGMAATLAGRF
jgi:hypothetical protein